MCPSWMCIRLVHYCYGLLSDASTLCTFVHPAHPIPAKYPEIPGIIPSFFTHSRNPGCYFINPEKSRNWLHSTFWYTHPDLLVTSTGERHTADMCSPELKRMYRLRTRSGCESTSRMPSQSIFYTFRTNYAYGWELHW